MIDYTAFEKNVIVELLTKVMEADLIIHPKEEELMDQLFSELQIKSEDLTFDELGVDECYSIVCSMDEEKRNDVKDMLMRMALADGQVDDRELEIIRQL